MGARGVPRAGDGSDPAPGCEPAGPEDPQLGVAGAWAVRGPNLQCRHRSSRVFVTVLDLGISPCVEVCRRQSPKTRGRWKLRQPARGERDRGASVQPAWQEAAWCGPPGGPECRGWRRGRAPPVGSPLSRAPPPSPVADLWIHRLCLSAPGGSARRGRTLALL